MCCFIFNFNNRTFGPKLYLLKYVTDVNKTVFYNYIYFVFEFFFIILIYYAVRCANRLSNKYCKKLRNPTPNPSPRETVEGVAPAVRVYCTSTGEPRHPSSPLTYSTVRTAPPPNTFGITVLLCNSGRKCSQGTGNTPPPPDTAFDCCGLATGVRENKRAGAGSSP